MNRAISRTSVALTAAVLVVVLPLALLVRLRWSPLADTDTETDDAVHHFVLSHPAFGDVARVLTHLGDPLVVTGVCAAVAVALFVRRRRRAAVYLVVVRVVAVVVGWLVKTAVDRARPHLVDPIAHAHGPSFPSGHALGSAALWASFAVLLAPRLSTSWLLAIAAVVPVVVAATRVVIGVHFVSDVVAGLALGWLVAVATADLLPLRAQDTTADDGAGKS